MAAIDTTTPGAYVFDWLDNELLPMLANSVGGLMQAISPVMGAAVITWFVLWAWRYIREQQPITDLLYKFFVLASVCFFAFSAPYYANTIIPMVNNLPFDLSEPFIGSGQDIQNAADNLINENSQIIKRMWDKAKFVSWSGVDLNNFANVTYATLIVGVLGNVYAAIGLFFMVVAKLMVNVLLAIGPAFIACAFFPAVRNYFNLWINQVVNYVILATIFAVIFSIQLTLINDLVQFDDGKLPPDRIDKIMVVYIIALATLTAIPMIASSLSGGMGLNGLVGNTVSTVMSMVNPAAAATRGLGKMAGGLGGGGGLGRNRITPGPGGGGTPPRAG
ncbi:type IV secretion system protein [Kushneria indalinina]|uniref:Type IV secretory pathway VirB6-like protein n=1 Tax=Kushneria indalinina DSM 14324 TaxID=1122140 RepID=A0A3D9DRR6_9GAMM|nr:type IV secretion system protein [Kushneria indalinina]REC93325.1 type IV secretory pathway VirB6-like protein [Kushneria indalinina DSM 14324]